MTGTVLRIQPLRSHRLRGQRNEFWLQGDASWDQGRARLHQGVETDFTEDLQKIGIPVLVAHGDTDQIVPIEASPSTARWSWRWSWRAGWG